MTYRSLVQMLAKKFGPRECPENYFQELSKREQKSGESVQSRTRYEETNGPSMPSNRPGRAR